MEPVGLKKPFRFSEVQNLGNNGGENHSPERRKKRKAIAKKRSNQGTSGIVPPCAEVMAQIEANYSSVGQSSENETVTDTVRCREEGQLSLSTRQRRSETTKPAEQVPIRLLSSCFSVDSGHGDDLSSSCESGAMEIQATLRTKQRGSDSDDEEVFEDARSNLGDTEAKSDSDSSAAYLTPRSQSLADIPSLDDSISLVGGEMYMYFHPEAARTSGAQVTCNEQSTYYGCPTESSTPFSGCPIESSTPFSGCLVGGSTPFKVVSSEDSSSSKAWDSLLQQTTLSCPSHSALSCPSHSPQDSAISSSSPQSTTNSPFSFPTTSSPSPPLSQTTPICCPGEWPDLDMQVEIRLTPAHATAVSVSHHATAVSVPDAAHEPTPVLALPRSPVRLHAGGGVDERPRCGVNHQQPYSSQPVPSCPQDSIPGPLPSCSDSLPLPHYVSSSTAHASNVPHSLHCNWVMWFDSCAAAHRNGFAADYQSSLDHLSSVQCIEDFWRVYNNLQPPSKLANANYHFFKENIRPLWEDPSNCHGGKWVLTFSSRNSTLDKVWEELLLKLISGEMSHLEDVTGAVVSRRKKGDRISLWTSTHEETKAIAVCRELIQVLLIACNISSSTYNAFIHELAEGRAGLQLAYLLHEDSLKSLKSYHNKAHITLRDHLSELLVV